MRHRFSALLSAHRQRGFTLVELLVVIAIVAILAGWAVPGLQGIIVGNAINSNATALQSDLSFARSEALKRGTSVTVCVANASSTNCDSASAGKWENGWIAFIDRDANGMRNTNASAGEDLVKVQQNVSGDGAYTIVSASSASVDRIRFERDGSTSAAGLRFTPKNGNTSAGRALCVLDTGRIELSAAGVQTC